MSDGLEHKQQLSRVLQQLDEVLSARKHARESDKSYVASLHQKGLNKILEKLGEECTETIIAAKDAQRDGDTKHVIYETADLWFHSLVMLSHLGESADSVLAELQRRLGQSGIEEKSSRQK